MNIDERLAMRERDDATAALQRFYRVIDRVADIAHENFGPLPSQSVAANLTAIERGIFGQRQIIDQLERKLRDLIRAVVIGIGTVLLSAAFLWWLL